MAESTDEPDVTKVDFARADFRVLFVAGIVGVLAAFAVGKLAAAADLDPDLQRAMGQAALGSSVPTYHLLGRGRLRLPREVVSLKGFSLDARLATLAGAGLIILAYNACGFVGGLLGGPSGDFAAGAIGGLAGAYAVGRWVGMRADRRPFVAAIAAGVLARAVTKVIDWVITPDPLWGSLGLTLSLETLFELLLGSSIWALVALLGSGVGVRAREGAYVAFLLTRVPRQTRAEILDLVYDESVRPRDRE
jgi:hypothetical protein